VVDHQQLKAEEVVRSLLTEDPRLTLRAISEQLKIGKDTVSTIIHGLNRRKICARFVPYFNSRTERNACELLS